MKFVLPTIVAAAASAVWGDVNLEFRAETAVIELGETAGIGLYATWDGTGFGQSVSAIELVFGWDTDFLSFMGLDAQGGASLLSSGFPTSGAGGLNESNPPGDGDGFYRALAPLGASVVTTGAGGTLITTLLFQGLAECPDTSVSMFASGGFPEVQTRVFDGSIPNTVVTGGLTGTSIAIVPAPGAGLALISAWMTPRRRRG